MLTLLRASKYRPGDWDDNDFDVVDDEGRLGRIVLTAASFTGGRDRPWFWSITCIFPSEPANWGNTASLEDAMAAFKARWLAVSAGGRRRLP